MDVADWQNPSYMPMPHLRRILGEKILASTLEKMTHTVGVSPVTTRVLIRFWMASTQQNILCNLDSVVSPSLQDIS